MKKSIYLALVFLLGTVMNGFAQETQKQKKLVPEPVAHFFNTNMDYQLRAFYSIGGSSPLGIPAEIRKIESYNPGLQLGLEANATKWLSDAQEFGIRLGVSVEGRGMKTEARTKNYLTQVIQNGAKIEGYYTGLVKTDVKNTYVTVPVSLVYNVAENWNIYGGLHVSFLIDQQFTGYVSDGYLREGTPVGQKIVFEGDSKAAYDFSDQVQTFQWGAQVGAEYRLHKHFKVFGTLNYDINGLLDPDFTAISFSMHNIYLDLGFAYQF